MDSWLRLLQSAALDDREACREWSLKLGYLTGNENEVYLLLTPLHPLLTAIYLDYAQRPHDLHDASGSTL